MSLIFLEFSDAVRRRWGQTGISEFMRRVTERIAVDVPFNGSVDPKDGTLTLVFMKRAGVGDDEAAQHVRNELGHKLQLDANNITIHNDVSGLERFKDVPAEARPERLVCFA